MSNGKVSRFAKLVCPSGKTAILTSMGGVPLSLEMLSWGVFTSGGFVLLFEEIFELTWKVSQIVKFLFTQAKEGGNFDFNGKVSLFLKRFANGDSVLFFDEMLSRSVL